MGFGEGLRQGQMSTDCVGEAAWGKLMHYSLELAGEMK